LEELDCSANNLERIDGGGKEKLISLQCYNNRLNSLNLVDCRSLQSLKVHNYAIIRIEGQAIEANYNRLSDTSFLNQLPNPGELKSLHLALNEINININEGNPFSKFINLEDLDLGTYNLPHHREMLNRLQGSLEHLLRGLDRLKKLDISNTDITIPDGTTEENLNDLLRSVKNFFCSSKERPESQVSRIEQLLKKSEH